MSVLWYVHDHGLGHLQRARCVVPHVQRNVVVTGGPGVHDGGRRAFGDRFAPLPSDVPPPGVDPAPGPWHHAPAAPETRARTGELARLVATHGCTTAVVDVSMEVVVLMRLLGLRVVALRQSGCRDDAAHRLGFASADAVWVPQRRHLEPGCEAADGRWHFTGPFSLLDADDTTSGPAADPGRHRLVVLLVGAGGHGLDVDGWRSATTGAPTGWRVVIAGATDKWDHGDVASVGRVDPIGALLRSADVVVTSAGWASVADVAATSTRLVVVPEARPFAEQTTRAAALADAGLAIVVSQWPGPGELGGVLDHAAGLDPSRWRDVHDGQGAARGARLVEEVAAA